MKNKVIILLASAVMALGATGRAAIPDEVPGIAAQPASYFYTGKPYDNDLGAFVFNYRNYDTDLNRWTTADPIGFPDGANPFTYVANMPTVSIDWLGWLTVRFGKVQGGAVWTKIWIEEYTRSYSVPLGVSWSWDYVDTVSEVFRNDIQGSAQLTQAKLPSLDNVQWVDNGMYTETEYNTIIHAEVPTDWLTEQDRRQATQSRTEYWERSYSYTTE